MNTKILYKLGLSLFSIFLLLACTDDDKDFSNRVYFDDLNETSVVKQILFKADITSNEQILKTSMARPETNDVTIRYAVDQSKVATYNEGYYAHASLLDSKYYIIENKEDTITPGAVVSKGIKLTFSNLDLLNIDSLYVLPISISQSNVGTLAGKNLKYFVFKGASLIDVVPSLTKNYFVGAETLPAADVLNNLSQLTIEGLIYANRFDSKDKSFISTFMGIEGEFLLRFGDAGFPMNQLQVATKRGNFPPADESKGMGIGKWFHVAVTFDGTNSGKVQIYIDGKLQSEGNISGLTSVNLGRGGINGFQVGRSYEDPRFLDGMMSELRIWNVIRTPEEISSNFYTVLPSSPGLVAYWKCNEGAGNSVKDFTTNGNNLSSPKEVNWINVALPAK